MVTVALIGPDGVGKTSLARALASRPGSRIRYLYMGVNVDASTALLPTTRLAQRVKRRLAGPAGMATANRRSVGEPQDAGGLTGVVRGLRSVARQANWIAEEWYRQLVAWRMGRRGYDVVFDRHFLPDYYAHDVMPGDGSRSPLRRLHGWLLLRVYPRPDLWICLDAPVELLRARRREEPADWLAERRQEYLRLAEVLRPFEIVNTARPFPVVLSEVEALIARARDGGR